MVSSYVDLLDTRYRDDLDDEAREYIEFAVEGAHRLYDLIDGVQAYAQIGDPEIDFGAVALDEALDGAVKSLKRKIETSDVAIQRDELPTVRGDRGQLTQLFQNLLSNAPKYSGDEPPASTVGPRKTSTPTRSVSTSATTGSGSTPSANSGSSTSSKASTAIRKATASALRSANASSTGTAARSGPMQSPTRTPSSRSRCRDPAQGPIP